MSSFHTPRLRPGTTASMLLAAAAALFVGNAQVRSDLIPTANGSATSTASPQTTSGSTPINITTGPVSGNGLYDVNSVLYLTNNNASAQTVTAQYTVGGSAVGTAFTVVVPGSGTLSPLQTVALPQQMNLSAGSNTVGLRVINTTGGVGGVTIRGSSLAVTGYTTNVISTANGPGSANLAANTSAGGTGPVTNLTVAVPGNANAQGIYSLNTALTINNNVGANQTVTARYIDTTNGNAPLGSSFSVNLPGSGTSVLTLPTQITGLGTTAHTIGIQLSSSSGAGSISVAAGSSLYATSYNSTGGAPSVSVATNNGTSLGNHNLTSGGLLTAISTVVPTASSPTFWDVNGSVMFTNTAPTNSTLTAQYVVNGVATGPTFSVTLAANGVGTFSMPTQFAALTAGTSVAIQLSTPGSADFNIDADNLSLVAHNRNPSVGTPEPASLSLAVMAAMAFGAAAYRRRKNGKVVV
jgi:hypothetical protein